MNSSQRIFNKMSIFRKWKLQTKHKKLTEEWALATSMKDLSENDDESIIINEQNENNISNDYDKNITKFTLKYLGKTSIDSERSQNATAEAIKSVIQNSKAIRGLNNNKKPQRVHLNICPKGIEMQDAQTNDIMLRVSIYKISYCSADAQHDHVFAFIGSEDDKNTGEEKLSCYVYLCPKRRIAHDVTLTVAKCFENAYENWRNSIEKKMCDTKNSIQSIKSLSSSTTTTTQSFDEKIKTNNVESIKSHDTKKDLLIDLDQDNEINTSDVCKNVNQRNYLQNTWISFDDEQIDVRRPLFQENSNWDGQLVF